MTLTIVPVISNRLLVNQLNNIRNELNSYKIGAAASGYMTNGPAVKLIGEAGPEAVVPLRRPLSQVDPSVRALSAYAQGKPYGGAKQMASGGVVDGGNKPTIVIQDGGAFIKTASTNADAILAETSARWAVDGY